jgi:hypothetical protein
MTNATNRAGCAVESLESRQLLTTFVVSSVADSGPGSLREAIALANNNSGADAIHFAINSGGHATIKPLTALPTLYGPVTLDATTQPGYVGQPLIELSGELAASGASGLTVEGLRTWEQSPTIVRGFVINRFASGAGISMSGTGVRIEGNYIGTDLTGNLAAGNQYGIGFYLGSQNKGPGTIGGTLAAARNVVSGNDTGMSFGTGSAEGTLVQGNYIGTNAAGTRAVPNRIGITVASAGITIGAPGGYANGGNLISGNTQVGIYGGQPSAAILNNRIGVDVEGNPVGAGIFGIHFASFPWSGRSVVNGNEIAYAKSSGMFFGHRNGQHARAAARQLPPLQPARPVHGAHDRHRPWRHRPHAERFARRRRRP